VIPETNIFTRGYATRENINFRDHTWGAVFVGSPKWEINIMEKKQNKKIFEMLVNV